MQSTRIVARLSSQESSGTYRGCEEGFTFEFSYVEHRTSFARDPPLPSRAWTEKEIGNMSGRAGDAQACCQQERS